MPKANPDDASRTAAKSLAVQGLTYLAGDPDRLGRFIALSGISPANIRAAAADPAFLTGVLEHILADESLLLDFAADAGVAPSAVGRAHAALAGPGWERDLP